MANYNATSKLLTPDERIVAHYTRLVQEYPLGRMALTRTCVSTNRRVAEVEGALRGAGIPIPEAMVHRPKPRVLGESPSDRFMRPWQAQVEAGRSPRDAVHHVRKGTHHRVVDCERILRAHGVELPPRGDGHVDPSDPAFRAATLFERHKAKGKPDGYAVGAVNASMRVGVNEVRRLLAMRGIFPEPGETSRPQKAKSPSAPKTKASTDRPRVAEIRVSKPRPKSEPKVVVAEYRDDRPWAPLSPQEHLERLRAKGERGRFVPVQEIFRGYGQEASDGR